MSQKNKEKQNFIENNLIILSKQTVDLLLEQDNGAELIGLYCFYYYTAKWQKTNRIKATTSYTAKGLDWGKQKVRDRKNQLKDLGLIEDAKVMDEETGQVKGWYIKLNYIWKDESHPRGLPDGGQGHTVDNSPPNALNDNNKNALIDNKENVYAVFEYYKEKIQPNCRFTDNSKKKIRARLKNWTAKELKQAIERFSKNKWWMENNSNRGPTWFFNSDKRIEQFLYIEPTKEESSTIKINE